MSGSAGRFITLEGGEGVGKSTQARLLQEALKTRGINALLTREPGGSGGAEMIRELLLGGDEERWSVRSEALLFAAARADHIRRTIKPALAVGRWVICDRFIDSSRAYQGGAGLVADDDIMALHQFGSRGLMPDRTILLTLPIDEAAERIRKRDGDSSDRIGSRSDDYHLEVASVFLTIAQAEQKRVRMVDALGTVDQVSGRVLSAIADLL
ncbi:dTMP kinase [Sphingobium sufflavum]|uniref:dTMP kinase n=1 Tax=Sphingobium sufflavum TaxID=1129547 RepID=UPI001F29C780|nr:dTMP kinase [Sphingobium sufflavum]MCE7797996.1 dTMP kinase [Sphingobium sufflavum]